jgi:hypothetical protein
MILKAVVIRMNKKDLSERDICTKFITPSLPAGFVDELPGCPSTGSGLA